MAKKLDQYALSLETIELKPDVVIDFSNPSAAEALATACVLKKCAFVCGTTGFTSTQLEKLKGPGFASEIPLTISYNFSVGMNFLFKYVSLIAKSLDDEYDVEICETHHNRKKDAPSGTALALLKSVAQEGMARVISGRCGTSVQRTKGEIGIHALRMGSVIGEHQIHFANTYERVSVTHAAENRDVFAHGALKMAKWISAQNPGVYEVNDMLGLK